MSSLYSVEKEKNILIMTISGKYSYTDFIKYPKIIRNECIKEKRNKIIVNVSPVFKSDIPLVELFFLGEKIASVLKDHFKVALIWDGENHNRFLQKVATNRLALIRTFDSLENAKAWLIRDREDEPLFS
ncbi:hypothetical protein [uncultured Eudoraea sp.]|uniref:hypothetical protein n=1 Tax=uncultured Eudoraea sp. TaxID=1035614 RepID=UPI0026046E1E|nr:hypothetical protein [uncultured Eudoraea sp.]